MPRRPKAQADTRIDIAPDLAILDEVIAGTYEIWSQLRKRAKGKDQRDAAKAQVHISKHAEALRGLIKTKVKLVISDQTMPIGAIKVTRKSNLKDSEIDAMKQALAAAGADISTDLDTEQTVGLPLPGEAN